MVRAVWISALLVGLLGAHAPPTAPPGPAREGPPLPPDRGRGGFATSEPTLSERTDIDDKELPVMQRKDVLEDREIDEAKVHVRPDGTPEVDMPPIVRVRAAVCVLFVCLGGRGLRPQSKKTVQGATAPMLVGIAGGFGWKPKPHRPVQGYLEMSRDVRTAMAEQARRERLERAPLEITRRAARLLHDSGTELAERKAKIFELWDDAACSAQRVDADDPSHDAIARSASTSRARIETFVDRFMPPDSEQGFTEQELARLNAGRCSAVPFEPYETSRPGRPVATTVAGDM